MTVRLHVNIDHVATLRQARGTSYPDPLVAAELAERAGAHGITIHLREDRRHIQDHDVERLRANVRTFLNLEMAATGEMSAIAARIHPDLVTLVPERREERTTEGGLDVVANRVEVERVIDALRSVAIPVSLFIDPDPAQIEASVSVGATSLELHTGDYANASNPAHELERLARAASFARRKSTLRIAAGHGLTVANTEPLVAAVHEIDELNIGHAVVCDAVFVGFDKAVKSFLTAIAAGEGQRK